MSRAQEGRLRRLMSISTISVSVTGAKESTQEQVPCIWYPIRFRKDECRFQGQYNHDSYVGFDDQGGHDSHIGFNDQGGHNSHVGFKASTVTIAMSVPRPLRSW